MRKIHLHSYIYIYLYEKGIKVMHLIKKKTK